MPEKTTKRRMSGRLIGLAMAIIILIGAGAISRYWLTHRPRARRQPPVLRPPLVRITKISIADHLAVIRAMGTVVERRSIVLTSRVGGKVTGVSPKLYPGGTFSAGEEILRIDPTDYELAVRQRKSDVARAEYELKLEMGRQAIARKEYKLLKEKLSKEDQELVLRKPHLNAARAALEAARAALEKAELDLRRTQITAPFNAVVKTKNISIGSQVSAGTPLATLVGTDAYWIEVSIPVDRLGWVRIPGFNSGSGSPVRVFPEADRKERTFRIGKVKSLMPQVDPEGRMARLLVEVDDPLCLKKANRGRSRLILGSFVQVEIEGKKIPRVARIPRSCLRDGNRIWIMTDSKTLDIRKVDTVWEEKDFVYIAADSLHDGDMLITTNLSTPVQGMRLRTVQQVRRSSGTPAGGEHRIGKRKKL